jgi:hypothetical protein
MNNPTEKSREQQEQRRQREQQHQDQPGGTKPGFDKDQIPQGGPSDNGPMTAPEDE